MKKLVLGLMVMGAFTQAQAQVLECMANIPRTICGSGKIRVNLDLKTNDFEMSVGALPCWMGDLIVTGNATIDTNPRDFYRALNYSLNGKSFRNEPKALGSLIVQDGVALLDIKVDGSHGHVLYRKQFNLVCKEIAEPTGEIG
jgi:hypothetical protein